MRAQANNVLKVIKKEIKRYMSPILSKIDNKVIITKYFEPILEQNMCACIVNAPTVQNTAGTTEG